MQINTIFHWLINWFWKTLFLYVPFFDDNSYIGTFKKPVEKEMNMPMLFDNRGQVGKEIYKFGCEGPSNGKKWMPCSMHKYKY